MQASTCCVHRNQERISHRSLVIANFLLIFSYFRYHGNRDFTYTVKFADPENTLLGAGIRNISPIEAQLMQIFCHFFQIFVTVATGVGLRQISLTQLNSQTLKTPWLVQKSGAYLLHKPSYRKFCFITAIGYRGNKGWSGVILNDIIKLADPENPRFGANSLYVSLTVPKL